LWQALRSRTVLLLAGLTFFNYFTFYSFAFWFPTMLKSRLGLPDAQLGVVGAVPYIVAFVVMQVNGWHSDKTCERRWHSAIPILLASGGAFGLLTQPRSTTLSLVFFTFVGLSISYLPAFWAIPTEILSQSAAAAAVGMINSVGSVAGFAGPYLFGYLHTRTGSFNYGLTSIMIAALVGGLLLLCVPQTVRVRAEG